MERNPGKTLPSLHPRGIRSKGAPPGVFATCGFLSFFNPKKRKEVNWDGSLFPEPSPLLRNETNPKALI